MNILNKLAQYIDPSELEIPQGTRVNSFTIDTALQIVFAIAAAVALLVMTISALRYTLAQGDSGSTAKAKSGIIYAAVGLVIALAGFTIVKFVVRGVS